MTWWLWLLFGLILCTAELLTPGGFYLLFFGVSALVIGLLGGVGVVEAAWLQWLLFSVLAIVALLLFRRPLRTRLETIDPDQPVDNLVNDIATAVEDMPVDTLGQVELRGTTWRARNSGETTIKSGQRCRIERVEGITLLVCALEA